LFELLHSHPRCSTDGVPRNHKRTQASTLAYPPDQ